MINLMYIVLTAMLALNVSSDVLNGFALVESGLMRTNMNVRDRNEVLYLQLEAFAEQNPQKGPLSVFMDESDSGDGNRHNWIQTAYRHGLPPRRAGGCVFLRAWGRPGRLRPAARP